MILLDAKPSLENLLSNLSGNTKVSVSQPEQKDNHEDERHTDIEILAGTWAGEEFIDKILILRSGKGVIIYKNGAIMNVSVSIDGSSVHIVQTGRSNASYFPELPRAAALKNAASAPPVEWNLVLTAGGSLEGSKQTLIQNGNSPSEVKKGTVNVVWQRRK